MDVSSNTSFWQMKRKKTWNLSPGIHPLQNVVSSLRTETTVKFFSSQLSRHVPWNLLCKYETRILGSDRKYVWYAYENMREKCLKMLHMNQYKIESKNIMTASLLCLQKNWLCYQNKDTNYIIYQTSLFFHYIIRIETPKQKSSFRLFQKHLSN